MFLHVDVLQTCGVLLDNLPCSPVLIDMKISSIFVLVDPIARNIAFPCFLKFVFLLYCLLCRLLFYCQCGLEWVVGDGQVHGA